MMAAYTIREIDPALYDAVRDRAKAEGRSLKGVLFLLLRLYARVGLAALESAADPPAAPAPRLRRAVEAQP